MKYILLIILIYLKPCSLKNDNGKHLMLHRDNFINRIEFIKIDSVYHDYGISIAIDSNNNKYYFHNSDSVYINYLYENLVSYKFFIPTQFNFDNFNKIDTVTFINPRYKHISDPHMNHLVKDGIDIPKAYGRSCASELRQIPSTIRPNSMILHFVNSNNEYFIPIEGIYDFNFDCIFNHAKLKKELLHGFFIKLNKNQFNLLEKNAYSIKLIGTLNCPGKCNDNNIFIYNCDQIKFMNAEKEIINICN